MKYTNLIFLVLFSAFNLGAQTFNCDGNWKNVGPNDIPYAEEYQYACGTGPIEFIRISSVNNDHMFAGSLNGGLFFSDDAGENWRNAGSDYWSYSACPWADFHPANENLWFGVMNIKGKNGKPGNIGKEGGLMRSTDKGTTWKRIAGVETFGGEYVQIFGTRFHPENPNKLFIMTTSGLFYTDDCTSSNVKWIKSAEVDGWIYDLDFLNGRMYISNFQFGNWHIYSFDQNNMKSNFEFDEFAALGSEKRHVTFEPLNDSLLVQVDYSKEGDKLFGLNPVNKKITLLKANQIVNYGSGHTFKVNPHNSRYAMLGNSTKLKYYDLETMKTRKIGSSYHVDIEFLEFHPKDSNIIYIATHGGVWKSEDDGYNWIPKTKGLGVAEVTGMSTDPNDANRIAIGCFHDGSSYYSSDRTESPSWQIVNGGDGLMPMFHPTKYNIVYTSNQYTGGGIYVSTDTVRDFKNIHNANSLKTSGWELAYVIHPTEENTLIFNYMHGTGESAGNIDIARTKDPTERKSAEFISDFKSTHNLQTYKVYALFNSKYYPNRVFAYLLEFTKDAEGNKITNHLLFTNNNILDSADRVTENWKQLEMPSNNWLGAVAFHPTKANRIYFAYAGGNDNPESLFGDKGMVYAVKYKESTHKVKREIDISKNIPNAVGGRYNICFMGKSDNILVATQAGIFMGDKRVLKGKGRWIQIGHGLPHCKPYGIDYNEKENVITVGLFGRGVWQYYL